MHISIKPVISKHRWFFFIILLYCILQYMYFFADGSIVLGGEGNFWLDFTVHLKNHGRTWQNIGSGLVTTTINAVFSYSFILSFIQNNTLKSYLIIASIYLMPFIGMYILLNVLNKKHIHNNLLLALFFVANPFSAQYLLDINAWNSHILFLYPAFFSIFYIFYNRPFQLFFSFGLLSVIFSYAFTNPPQMALIFLSFPIMLSIASYLKMKRVTITELLMNSVVIYVSLFLFNLWWLLHWIVVMPDAQQVYTLNFAKSWLSNQKRVSPLIMKDIFSFTWMTPRMRDYTFISYYYNHPVIRTLSYIPFFLIFSWFLIRKNKQYIKNIVYYLLIIMFVISLFLKGTNSPAPNLLLSCFDRVPYCYLFKTATAKFGVLFVFITTLLLHFIFSTSPKLWFRFLFYLYMIVILFPFIIGTYIPDTKIDTADYMTRKYREFPEFQEFLADIKTNKLDFRFLSLPNAGNYQIKMHLYDDKFYTGLNPLLYNTIQSHIADHNREDFESLFKRIDQPGHSKLLGLFSIKYISFNRRIRSWFGNLTGKTQPELETLLNESYTPYAQYGQTTLYNNPDFVPHVWTPQHAVQIPQDASLDVIGSYFESPYTSVQTGFFPIPVSIPQTRPVVEFKKIHEAKYRIILHGISAPAPLIFNTAYHRYWKLYAKKNDIKRQGGTPIPYPEGASADEVQSFVQNGWLTVSGNQFISKKIFDTIQNDNLPNGTFYETFIGDIRAVGERTHMKANEYANAWVVDPSSICTNGYCRRNPDGSYDMELILEFWPERVFYGGLTLSIVVFIISLGYFIIDFRRKKTHT